MGSPQARVEVFLSGAGWGALRIEVFLSEAG